MKSQIPQIWENKISQLQMSSITYFLVVTSQYRATARAYNILKGFETVTDNVNRQVSFLSLAPYREKSTLGEN